MPTLTDRLIELGYLIALGKIGIKVVFACKPVESSDLTMGSEAHHDSVLDDLLVTYGQRAGKSKGYRVDVLIWLSTIRGGGVAEDLRLR